MSANEQEFWSARKDLAYMHDYARAIRVAPWSLLACALARVSTAAPTNIVIPALTGDRPASLNFDVGVVGNPGSGKGIAEAASRTLIPDLRNAVVTQPASGEGLAAMFATRIQVPEDEGGSKGETRISCIASRALLSIPEIGTLGGASKRQGSTVIPALCSAWSGESLGAFNKAEANRLTIPEHAYRLSLIVGIQPAASSSIFDAIDVGLPQRFLWTSTLDVNAPTIPTALPTRRFPFDTGKLPADPTMVTMSAIYESGTIRGSLNYKLVRMSFPQTAFNEADAQRLNVLHGGSLAPLDSHLIQLKAKVAALLALMDGARLDVDEEDWQLADTIIQRSCKVRDQCLDAMHTARQEQKAEYIADDNAAHEKAETKKLESAKKSTLNQLERHDPQREGIKGYDISRMLGRNGKYAYTAIEELFTESKLDKLMNGGNTASSTWAITC